MSNKIITTIETILGLTKNKEEFESGFGFDMPESSHPLYLNLYSRNLSTDFGLFNIIQTLKYKVFKPLSRGIDTNAGFGQVSLGPSLNPLIIVPGLGTSRVVAIWSKDGSPNVKQLDLGNNFEKSSEWNCRRYQDEWSTIWFPSVESAGGMSQYCWADNTYVLYNKERNIIMDAEGVRTQVPNFGGIDFVPPSYMDPLIQSLQAVGYKNGTTLFSAPYDFRKICSKDMLEEFSNSFRNLIEKSVSQNNGKPAILLGHDLGSPLVNYFLTKSPQDWKDKYIKFFVSFSGSFGGCPKALRTLLSGTDISNRRESDILRSVSKNFSGIQWMLPSPSVYGDFGLVNFRKVTYTAKDIPKLLRMAGYEDSALIYENIVLPVQVQSLQAPHVTTYIFCGENVMTESSYNYNNSLREQPVKNYPYYSTELAYANNFDFPQQFNGDGTIPKFALEIPMSWSKTQNQPIYYRFYQDAEHKEILELQDPVRDFLSILNA